MSRGFPSMTALLGLLAVAGYQHRDKIAEMLGGLGQNRPGGTGQSGAGGFLNQLSERLGGGPNKPVTPPQLEQAIGPEVLETLSKQTGLSREELLARLSRELPDAVDRYTPQGRLPTETDFPRS